MSFAGSSLAKVPRCVGVLISSRCKRGEPMASHERGEMNSHYKLTVCTRIARGQAAVCASPTLKRSVRKYNYSEDVRVNETADGGEECRAAPPPARA